MGKKARDQEGEGERPLLQLESGEAQGLDIVPILVNLTLCTGEPDQGQPGWCSSSVCWGQGRKPWGLGAEKEPQLVTAGPCGTRGTSEAGPCGAPGGQQFPSPAPRITSPLWDLLSIWQGDRSSWCSAVYNLGGRSRSSCPINYGRDLGMGVLRAGSREVGGPWEKEQVLGKASMLFLISAPRGAFAHLDLHVGTGHVRIRGGGHSIEPDPPS